MKNFLTEYAKEQIKEIHDLSKKVNSGGKTHRDVLLSFIKQHPEEILKLQKEGDEHFITEAGDLAVLCLELILQEGKDPDEVMGECFLRFRNKLEWLKEKNRSYVQ